MRVCSAVGCPALVEKGGYCDAHRPKRKGEFRSEDSRRRQRELKKNRWKVFSAQYRRANPSCVVCGAPAEAVDHVDGEGPGGARGYDVTNLMSLCRSHHSTKTNAMDHGLGRPRVER